MEVCFTESSLILMVTVLVVRHFLTVFVMSVTFQAFVLTEMEK